jgi:glycerol-3-phosphate dehydrogenase
VYSLVGGKWTSYRAFSEQTTDKALEFLKLPRRKDTRSLAIGGGKGYPTAQEELKRRTEGAAAWSGMKAERAEELFERYGTRAELVAEYIGRGQDAPLKSLPSYSRREIGFLAQCEKAVHLDDVLLRRSMLAMLGKLSRAAIEEVGDALAEACGWTAAQKKKEIERALAILDEEHEVKL